MHRNVFVAVLEAGYKSQMKVLAGLVSSEVSVLLNVSSHDLSMHSRPSMLPFLGSKFTFCRRGW